MPPRPYCDNLEILGLRNAGFARRRYLSKLDALDARG